MNKMDSYWLKPIFIVIAIFIVVYLLITLGSSWGVEWETEVNPTMIELLPWLVALGLAFFVFVYIMEKK